MTGQQSNFLDDSNLLIYLQNESGDDLFEEINFGLLDEEEKQYLIVDKDTGKVYDTRNENHVSKVTQKTTKI